MPSAAVRPGGRQVQVAALGVGDEPVRHEPAEHLARGLGRDPDVARDLGRRDAARLVGSGQHAQGEEVLLGGGRQVALIVASGHRGQDTGLGRDPNDAGSAADARWPDRSSQASEQDHPSAARRESPSAAPPGRRQDERRDDRGRQQRHRRPSSRSTRRPGSASRRAKARIWRTRSIGPATPSSQVAAKRPQPVISPTSQLRPRAIGSQPMSARARRPRDPPKRSSVRAWVMSGRGAPEVGRWRLVGPWPWLVRRLPSRGRVAGAARRRTGRRAVPGAPSRGLRSGRTRRRVPPGRRRVGRARPGDRPLAASPGSSRRGRSPARPAAASASGAGRGRIRAACPRPPAGRVPGTPVRACEDPRIPWGSASSTCRSSCRTSSAPPQSGSNGPASAPSYDVDPRVALFGARVLPPGGGVPDVPWSGRGS